MKEYYDEMLVLDSALRIGDNLPIYGILLNGEIRLTRTELDQYIIYLAGLENWVDEGNEVSADGKFWIDKRTNESHLATSDFVENYQKNCNERVGYKIYKFDCDIIHDYFEIEDSLIVEESLVNRYKRYYNCIEDMKFESTDSGIRK